MLRTPPSLVSSATPASAVRHRLLLSSSCKSPFSNNRCANPTLPFLFSSSISTPRPPNPSRVAARFRCSTAHVEDSSSSDDAGNRGLDEVVTRTEVDGSGKVCEDREVGVEGEGRELSVGIGSPSFPLRVWNPGMSLGDRVFLLLAFIACTMSIAFTSLVVAAVPTLIAMKRAATSFAKLADTAREELPSTMTAIRLTGMEISDLTLELSDLSQEIADGVSKSAQAVQAAEAGIRHIGALARYRTISMIEERANLPNISLRPVVAGVARKTSSVVGRAGKTLVNIIARGESNSESEESLIDRVEI